MHRMYQVNHSWLYGSVKPYFESQGIKLLKDDLLFIERCLGNIPPERHREVIKSYFVLWGAKVSPKENVEPSTFCARYEANTFLRNLCEPQTEDLTPDG